MTENGSPYSRTTVQSAGAARVTLTEPAVHR